MLVAAKPIGHIFYPRGRSVWVHAFTGTML
jgi:hypothetical protein